MSTGGVENWSDFGGETVQNCIDMSFMTPVILLKTRERALALIYSGA